LAWDSPGAGRSFEPPEDYGLHGYADCLAAFMQALALERPYALGLSFGSGVVLELFRRHPGVPEASCWRQRTPAGWARSAARRRSSAAGGGSRPLRSRAITSCAPSTRALCPGHMVDIEAPEALNEEVRSFLRQAG